MAACRHFCSLQSELPAVPPTQLNKWTEKRGPGGQLLPGGKEGRKEWCAYTGMQAELGKLSVLACN